MTEPEPAAGQPASPLAPPGIDTTVAHPARMLNYVLGGTANFPVVLVSDWRPDPGQPRPDPHLVTCYGAVARKP